MNRSAVEKHILNKPKENAVKTYNFIDLFAGCGGLSEGFYRQGFHALAHVEIDHFACETLKTRMRYYGYGTADQAVMEQDITAKDIVRKIKAVVGDETVDIIIGGRPARASRLWAKPETKIVCSRTQETICLKAMSRSSTILSQNFFVFENVLGLLDTELRGKRIFKIILRRLRKNYRVLSKEETIVLNATSYGVPQERKRVILIGTRRDLDVTPGDVYAKIQKTHYLPGDIGKQTSGLNRYVTVRDAIGDLPKLHSGEGAIEVNYPNDYSECSEYVKLLRKPSDTVLRYHVARKNNEADIERYKAMAENHWNFLQLLDFRPDLAHEKSACFQQLQGTMVGHACQNDHRAFI